MITFFKGHKIEYNLAKSNLRGMVANLAGVSEKDVTTALVMYDPKTNTITVDERASETYAWHAAIHESICCGPYSFLAPATDNPEERCGLIDLMLVDNMPESEREAYVANRIEMFDTLISMGLNPQLNHQFQKAIELLKRWKP